MKLIRSIMSIFLASLVLIASTCVTVNLHLCAGRVQSVALFVKAEPCKEVQKSCHGTEHRSKKNGCCQEKSILLKGKESTAEVKASVIPSFNLITVILPVLCSVIDLDSSVAAPAYAHYKPPLIEHDITVRVQSFLI